ncbi:MAG TPA: glycosyltransferase family 39 protein [Verrucomicrobiae bacterium]|nr:glycosyltransferase family 39 protein [Verrucomicrobiae bacterium]
MKHLPVILTALLLLLMAVLAGGSVRRESIALDEVAHLGAGVSYLQKLDLRMNQEHPPLSKVLAAIPLVLRGVRADYSDVSWSFSHSVFNAYLGQWVWGHFVALRWNDPYSTVFWARVPMLLLTLALGACIYLFAAKLGSPWGGVLCVAAYVSTPAFLVFGPLVLSDVPVTFFVLLTMWAFAALWRNPSRRNMVWFGLAFGAALLTKFSAGILLFAALAFRLSLRWAPTSELPADATERKHWRKVRARYFWKGVFVAALTVYAVYLVLSLGQPSEPLAVLGHNFAALALRRILFPAFLFLRGVGFFMLTSRRPTFLFGHVYTHGVWFFFPVAFALKSTLAFLVMLLLTLCVAMIARRKDGSFGWVAKEMQFYWRAVWTFLLTFFIFCIISPMTISIRHFTIPVMLVILLMAPVPRALDHLRESRWQPDRFVMAAYVVLALVSLATMVRTYPYYMPFLNSLSFGRPGYALITDSNLDWDQALPDVQQFVQQHRISRVLVDEYGFIDTTVYVPNSVFWNCQTPAPSDAGQWAVVSADLIEDSHNCVWLLQFPHTAIAGGSMYALQLPDAIPPVGDPNGPPAPSAQHQFPGPPGMDGRAVFLRCIHDPNQLQPTMDGMMAQYQANRKKH